MSMLNSGTVMKSEYSRCDFCTKSKGCAVIMTDPEYCTWCCAACLRKTADDIEALQDPAFEDNGYYYGKQDA